jgi:hypothetical protein
VAPDGDGALFRLPGGQPLSVRLGPASLDDPGSATTLRVSYDPSPPVPNEAAAGRLGGGNVQPLGAPIEIRLEVESTSGAADEPGAPARRVADLRLPVLTGCQPDTQFSWLIEIDQAGQFLGYLRLPAVHDPGTNSLSYRLPVGLLRRALLLPVCLGPAWVMNHDPGTRIWSGPNGDAIDFGAAAPQWTRMTVVGPQVGLRLLVFNEFTANYGWVDVAGLGPVGGPTADGSSTVRP